MSKLEADRTILKSLISQTQLVRMRAEFALAEAALRRERIFLAELEKIEAKMVTESRERPELQPSAA